MTKFVFFSISYWLTEIISLIKNIQTDYLWEKVELYSGKLDKAYFFNKIQAESHGFNPQ